MKAKQRILVVDDDANLAGIVKQSLERTGLYEMRIEGSGALALQAAREFKPDLMLLDVVMPECDGPDVLAQLRGDPELKGLPVVFLTGTMTEIGLAAREGIIAGCPVVSKQSAIKKIAREIEKSLQLTAAKG